MIVSIVFQKTAVMAYGSGGEMGKATLEVDKDERQDEWTKMNGQD